MSKREEQRRKCGSKLGRGEGTIVKGGEDKKGEEEGFRTELRKDKRGSCGKRTKE